MRDKLTRLLATFFYIGDIPPAPGSVASIAGALMAVILHDRPLMHAAVFGVIAAVGFGVSGRLERMLDRKDPSCVVIDEVAGSLLAFYLLPLSLPVFLTAFFLFRAFDMFKIYPADRMEKLPGGLGIMLDDLFAGIYTNVVMQVALRWAGIL